MQCASSRIFARCAAHQLTVRHWAVFVSQHRPPVIHIGISALASSQNGRKHRAHRQRPHTVRDWTVAVSQHHPQVTHVRISASRVVHQLTKLTECRSPNGFGQSMFHSSTVLRVFHIGGEVRFAWLAASNMRNGVFASIAGRSQRPEVASLA